MAGVLEAWNLFLKNISGIRVLSHNKAWTLPPAKWYRLNVDVAINMVASFVSTSGLIRDNKGKFICGFIVPLEFCTPFTVECWAIYHGLKFAWVRLLVSL